jgi:hypothetical protein
MIMERRDGALLEPAARMAVTRVHDRAADIVFRRFDHFFTFSVSLDQAVGRQSQYDPGIRPGNAGAGGTTGNGGGKARRLGARTGTLTPPRIPNSGTDIHDLVGEMPILSPFQSAMLNQPRIAASSSHFRHYRNSVNLFLLNFIINPKDTAWNRKQDFCRWCVVDCTPRRKRAA